MSNLSNFESVLGNAGTDSTEESTKGDPQGKQWKVNYHLKEDESFESVLNLLEELFEPICDKYIFGEEYGKSGKTPHVEGGFILLSDRMRRSAIKSLFCFSDCQKSKGTKKTREYKWNKLVGYCSKECNDIRANFTLPRPLLIIPVDILRKDQQDIVDQFKKPCPPIWESRGLLHWFWEPNGGWGKSVVSLWMIDHMNAL